MSMKRLLGQIEHKARVIAAGMIAIGFTIYFAREPVYRLGQWMFENSGLPPITMALGPMVVTEDGRMFTESVSLRPGPVEIRFRDGGSEVWDIIRHGQMALVIKRNGQMLAEHGHRTIDGDDYLVIGAATNLDMK